MSWLRTQARQTSASGSWRSPMRDASNGAISVEEVELFVRVIKQYAKTFQEEVQR